MAPKRSFHICTFNNARCNISFHNCRGIECFWNLTIQAVTKSPIHVPTAAIFIKLSFRMPMLSVTMWGLRGHKGRSSKRRREPAGRRWRESRRGTKRKCSLPLSIVILAVRVDQYQSDPVKAMSDGSAPRIVNYLHRGNGIHALPFGPVVFGK